DFPLTITRNVDHWRIVFADQTTCNVATLWVPGKQLAQFEIDGETIGIKTGFQKTGYRLRWRGIEALVYVRNPRVHALAKLMPERLPPDTSKKLLCPMPGVVTSIAVNIGDTVEAGQPLATVEAMKMENVLRAERRATVKSIAAKAGESLAVDEIIMEFE